MAAITANAIRRLESTLAVTSAMRAAFPARSGCRAHRTVSRRGRAGTIVRAVVPRLSAATDLFEENEQRPEAEGEGDQIGGGELVRVPVLHRRCDKQQQRRCKDREKASAEILFAAVTSLVARDDHDNVDGVSERTHRFQSREHEDASHGSWRGPEPVAAADGPEPVRVRRRRARRHQRQEPSFSTNCKASTTTELLLLHVSTLKPRSVFRWLSQSYFTCRIPTKSEAVSDERRRCCVARAAPRFAR